jgi:nitrogen-specific signal transduction histidine kinase
MRSVRLDRRALLGGVLGGATALLGEAVAGARGDIAFTSVLVVAVTVSGLLLGARAATWAYVAAAVVSLVALLDPSDRAQLDAVDIVRFGSFLVGSVVILVLVRRAEMDRIAAAEALRVSRAAEERLETERQAAETARRATDAALRDAERVRARLGEVAESIPEPLIVYDDDHRGSYGNRAAMRLFGRSFVERPLDDWGIATEPRDEHGVPLPREEWPQVVSQSEPCRRRLILRNPTSGRDVMVDVEGTPIPGGGAVLLLRDVGKEEDERRRLSRFASFVAHELRNPLAVAKARMELAKRIPALPERAASHSRRALESVDAAIDILERLELYSRADTGHVEAVREPFELGPVLGRAIEQLRTRGSERDITVELAPDVRVMGDPHLSAQAIANLLTNADRYSTPGTLIHIEVEPAEVVTLRVRDQGPGIEDAMAGRIFIERVTAGRGLGLGLYLVRASMEAMGGSVTLERRRPGAVFALRWPRARP